MLEMYDDLLTTEEACAAMKVGKNALYLLLSSGQLKGYRNGRVWRIPTLHFAMASSILSLLPIVV